MSAVSKPTASSADKLGHRQMSALDSDSESLAEYMGQLNTVVAGTANQVSSVLRSQVKVELILQTFS